MNSVVKPLIILGVAVLCLVNLAVAVIHQFEGQLYVSVFLLVVTIPTAIWSFRSDGK